MSPLVQVFEKKGKYPESPALYGYVFAFGFTHLAIMIVNTATAPQTRKRPSIPFHIMSRESKTFLRTASLTTSLL
jgi:hypothetical protein